MATSPDVLVIGGGIIGLSCAYFLAKSGLSVEVIDKGELGREASWAGAGILPPGNPDRTGTPFDRLRAYSTSRFPAFSDELREQTGIDNGFRVCGGIEFLSPDEEDATDLWAAEALTFERVGAEELRRLEPHLHPPAPSAYHLPGVAQVRNPWHIRALVAACRQEGVRLTTTRWVRNLYPYGAGLSIGCADSFSDTSDDIQVHEAEVVLLTVGAWADEFLAPRGTPCGVRAVRGQMVLFHPGRPLLSRVITVGKRYLVPRADGRILAGSTEEPEAGFEKANTPEGVAELVRFARELVPALAGVEPEATWAGLRPGSPDGMPFLGPVPGYDNLFAAVGHFRAGIQLSLGTAEVMTALMTGRAPPVPVGAFRLDRPPAPGGRFAFRS